jgi:hypothetical protein
MIWITDHSEKVAKGAKGDLLKKKKKKKNGAQKRAQNAKRMLIIQKNLTHVWL